MPEVLEEPTAKQIPQVDRQRALLYVLDFLMNVKYSAFRKSLEESWIANYHMLVASPEGIRQHEILSEPGRSNVYHGMVSREVRRIVGSIRKAVFPNPSPFIVQQSRPGEKSEKAARAVRQKVIKIFDDVEVYAKMEPFFYNFSTYGTGVLKLGWNKKRLIHTLRSVDVFSFFVYPETAADVDSAFCCMEQIPADRVMLEAGAASGMYDADAVQRLIQKRRGDISDATQYQLRRFGPTSQMGSQLAHEHELLEFWGYYNIDGEDAPLVDCIITVADRSEVLRVVKNETGMRPYVSAPFISLSSEYYGMTPVSTVVTLQQHLNAVNRQALDCATYALNPIVAVDPIYYNDPNTARFMTFQPGGKWPIPPDNVRFLTMPDVSQTGYLAASQLANTIGTSLHSDLALPSGGRTATQFLGQSNVISDILSGAVANIEAFALTPLLKKMLILARMNMSTEEKLVVTGEDGVVSEIGLNKDDIDGVSIRWAAGEQTMAAQIKSQQLIQFFSIASRIPPQVWMSFGMRFRLDKLLRKLWSEGLMLQGEADVFEPIASYKPLDPNVENLLLAQGINVPVHPLDNPMEHMAQHGMLEKTPNVIMHIQQHEMLIQSMMTMPPVSPGQGDINNGNGPPKGEREQDFASGLRPTGSDSNRGAMNSGGM